MPDDQQGAANNIYPFQFPTLARSWDPFAQRGTMSSEGEGPLWREMVNLQLRDGQLEKRSRLIDQYQPGIGGGYGLVIPKATFTTFDGDGDTDPPEQNVMLIFDFDHWPDGSADVGRLIVTNNEIFLTHQNGTWSNMTPVYDKVTTGAINYTNGSKTVTGSDSWDDHGIAPGNAINMPDGKVYKIASVTNNTSLELVNNYGGTTGGPSTYSIIRVHEMVDNHVFAQYFNGNLYCGGHFGANRADDGGTDSVILRWSDINKSTHTGTTAEYVFQGAYDYSEGVCDAQDYYCHIRGFQCMPDGRIVTVGSYFDVVGAVGSGNARVWYSSHLNQQVWTLSPGGAFDVVSQSSEVTAMGKIAGGYSVHFFDGISMLTPTGMDDPPLAEYPIDADVGAVGPRVLSNNGEVEFFLGRSWQIHAFDGASAKPLSRVPRYIFKNIVVSELSKWACADIDSHRGHYHALCRTKGPFIPGAGQPAYPGMYTHHLVSDYRTGDSWQYHWTFPIYSIYLKPMHEYSSPLDWPRQTGLGLVGCSTYSSAAFDTGATGCYALLDSGDGLDEGPPDTPRSDAQDGGYGGYYATTDDQDFGLPGRNKYVDHVTLWYTGSGTTIDIYCAVSKDGGVTWDTRTKQVSPTAAINHINFFFDKDSGENWRIEIGLGDERTGDQDWEGGPKFTKMTVWVVPEADVEYHKNG